jgi:catechol 2,3-dioxygenase-like lactoylglutathione lyase family enzyme
MQVERVDFVSFLTQDIPRAKRFYSETLGLAIESESESDMEFTLGQVTLDVFDPSSIGQPFAPSLAGFALRVPDVAATRAELESKGVEFAGETIDTGVCHMAFFEDPDGNALMLHRRYAPFDDGRQP